jgi:hypothetical protein
MKCPECERLGMKSTLTTNGWAETYPLGGVRVSYDENGKHHAHNPDITVAYYKCSNDHNLIAIEATRCWCGWGYDKEVRIHDVSSPAWRRTTTSMDAPGCYSTLGYPQ